MSLNTRVISLSGVDGTGKSTLLQIIQDRLTKDFRVLSIPTPQYYLNPELPYAEMSLPLENMGKYADQIANPGLKANISFVQMSLQGRIIEQFINKGFDFILCERNALIDILAYAQFYLPLLKIESASHSDTRLEGDLVNPEVDRYVQSLFPQEVSISNLHQALLSLFDKDQIETIKNISQLLHSRAPELYIQLTANAETLKNRIALKKSEYKEAHEGIDSLLTLQETLGQISQQLCPNNQIKIATDSKNIEQIADEIMSLLF